MSGQIGAALDARAYTFDGTMVPIHDSALSSNGVIQSSTKPQALQSQADAQRGSVDDVRVVRGLHLQRFPRQGWQLRSVRRPDLERAA
jgi:hypothetical protein